MLGTCRLKGMLDFAQVEKIVGTAASAALSASSLLRTHTEPTTDQDGHEALLVTLVINDLQKSPISGDTAGDTILRVRQDLQRAGEDRTVIIEFATESDLSADGSA